MITAETYKKHMQRIDELWSKDAFTKEEEVEFKLMVSEIEEYEDYKYPMFAATKESQ